ncbi:MAG TPA: hypothetical protein VF550_03260 [Polyangia bacterium]
MHTPQRLSWILAALVAVIPIVTSSVRAAESAAVSEAAVDRMIDLNKQAYADIREQHYQAAKYRLSEALVISETAGLENDEMTARTFIHLAAVYLTGLKDRDEAIQQFMLALRINPNITLTPGLESPALKSAYLQAREQMDLPPNPDTTAPPAPQAKAVPAPEVAVKGEGGGQPPPSRVGEAGLGPAGPERARPSTASGEGVSTASGGGGWRAGPEAPNGRVLGGGEAACCAGMAGREAGAEGSRVGEPSQGSPISDVKGATGIKDPDLPARVPSPLYCHLPVDTPPGEDVVVRCLTQKQQRKSSATFHYRPRGAEGEYVGLPMARSPKGWLMFVVPGRAVQGTSLSYYVKAEIPDTPNALYLGHPEAPNELIIRKPPQPDGADDASDEPEPVPGPANAHPLAGNEMGRPGRLRAPGSFWISLASGTGAVYHRRETVDSNAKNPINGAPVSVQPGFSPATILQIEPEIGYQLSKRFSISVMGRYQFAPKDADRELPGDGENAVSTSALAGFVRGQFAFLSRGGFQTYASGGLGMGTSFLAVVERRCGTTSCSLDHSDTLHGGPVGLSAGMGVIYHFRPSFGVFVDVKEIATLPKFMALTEINVGLTFAHRFQGSDVQKQASSTRHLSWR